MTISTALQGCTLCPDLKSWLMCSSIFFFSSSVASRELRASSPNSFLRVPDTVSPASTIPWREEERGREGMREKGEEGRGVTWGRMRVEKWIKTEKMETGREKEGRR